MEHNTIPTSEPLTANETFRKIDGTDEFLRRILQEAELPALLPALAQATGDLRLVDHRLRPAGGPVGAVPKAHGGMSAVAQEEARELALEALKMMRDGHGSELDVSDDTNLMALLTFMTGEINTEYLPLLNHELGFGGDIGKPDWGIDSIAPSRASDFKVVVIGAGMSGIGMAHRLQEANLDVVVFEKNDDVGGTWWENSYPGCRLDTPNFTYSYSFLQKATWRQAFTEQRYLREYFGNAATTLGVREAIRFNTEVRSLRFDDGPGIWHIEYQDASGLHTMTANAVVSAVGQLNRPNIPDIEGADEFEGLSWHTAEWRHDIDLSDLRVAVIGTGASAFQVIPTIAPQVENLVVFQRTPPWMYPAADYHADIPFGMRWLLQRIPPLHRWYRFYQFYMNLEGRLKFMEVDPHWSHPVSLSSNNEELREALQDYIDSEFADRPDLLAGATPNYPPGAKRLLRDNGIWAKTLKSANVDVVNTGIERIERNGIRDAAGNLHEVDVIVYGTGFKASDFLFPMTVQGKNGTDLQERWQGDLRAHYGVCIPDFPNLFMLYGPNTNLVVNGSLVFLQEMGMEFILSMLRTVIAGDHRTIEVQQEAFERYNAWVDEGNSKLVWGAAKANSWYKSASGRVSQNWPYSMLDYWKGTHEWDKSDFILQ